MYMIKKTKRKRRKKHYKKASLTNIYQYTYHIRPSRYCRI